MLLNGVYSGPGLRHPEPQDRASASSSAQQSYSGAFTDPNGNVTPDDPTVGATYYQDANPPLNVWYWSVTDQEWYQFSG